MIAKASMRYCISDLLSDPDAVKALNARTAFAQEGDVVGHEDVWCDPNADQNGEQDALQAQRCSVTSENLVENWEFVSPLLRKPQSEDNYNTLALALDELLKLVGEDELHPLMSLVDIIGDWIEEWDHKHHPMPKPSGVDVLGYLMREHGLSQSELPGVGTQSVVSEILSGKRQLNLRQIRWLAEHFKVPVDVFI